MVVSEKVDIAHGTCSILYDDDIPIKFDKKLVQSLLHIGLVLGITPCSNSIQFVNKHNTRCPGPGSSY